MFTETYLTISAGLGIGEEVGFYCRRGGSKPSAGSIDVIDGQALADR